MKKFRTVLGLGVLLFSANSHSQVHVINGVDKNSDVILHANNDNSAHDEKFYFKIAGKDLMQLDFTNGLYLKSDGYTLTNWGSLDFKADVDGTGDDEVNFFGNQDNLLFGIDKDGNYTTPGRFIYSRFDRARATNLDVDNAKIENSKINKLMIGVNETTEGLHIANKNFRIDNGKMLNWGNFEFKSNADEIGEDDEYKFYGNNNVEKLRIDVPGNIHIQGDKFFTKQNNLVLTTSDNALTLSSPNSNNPKTLNITNNGIGIGTENPSAPLDVNGNIKANAFISNVTKFPDYVFEKDYELTPLEKVEDYVKTNKHLPKMPSEKELISKGMNINEISIITVEKLEELYLYTIQLNNKIKVLEDKINQLKTNK